MGPSMMPGSNALKPLNWPSSCKHSASMYMYIEVGLNVHAEIQSEK